MEEEKYIKRCISLARNGLCNAAPNPMVGAVIVCDGLIIGEGYHVQCGEAHAEVNAINAVRDKRLLKRATLYVSLEPCSHYGKTPPCADLIIKEGIPRVVIGCQDPFSEVAGRGIKKLQEAGCEVIVGILEEECRELIHSFITFHTLHRPYIILKWAESADGFIDKERTEGEPTILSTPLTSMIVHKRRAESAAIIVGTRTALLDNPSLTVRNWYGKNPVRVVLDRNLTIPASFHLLDDNVRTLVFTAQSRPSTHHIEYITIDYKVNILPSILNALYERKLQTLLVEGGAQLLQSFIDEGYWDESFVEISAKTVSTGVKAPQIETDKMESATEVFGVQILQFTNKKG